MVEFLYDEPPDGCGGTERELVVTRGGNELEADVFLGGGGTKVEESDVEEVGSILPTDVVSR